MKYLQLVYFREVVRSNNITKASKALFVSQPAISASIKELEEEFGVQLFHRHNNRLTLTPEGQFFYDHVAEILDHTERLEAQMRDLGRKLNRIRLGVPPMIGIFLFPPLFDAFKEKYPEVAIEILESGSLEIRQFVMDDQVDLAIGILDEQMSPQFTVLPFHQTELVYCVGKNHPLAGRKSVRFRDLAEEKLILMKADSFQNPKIKARFAQEGIEPNVQLYSSQLYTIKQFVSENGCGAFVFREIAEMDPELVPVPMEDPVRVSIGLLWKTHGLLYSGAEHFIRFLRDEFVFHRKS